MFGGFDTVLRFINLRQLLGGVMGNKWWRKGSHEEDEVMAKAANELIEGLIDADTVNKVKENVGIDLRDQVTVEEAEDWHKERQLRGFGDRRN